jgi:hypothetical protein
VYPEDPPVARADALQDLLAGYRRQAKVVLIDVWSMSNDASRDRFGFFVDLHLQHRASGLQCVAVAFDHPGRWFGEIAPFLRSVRCSYPCVIVPPSGWGEVVGRLAYEWDGSIPAVLVFDRDGRLAAEMVGQPAISKIRQVVEDVLAGRHKPIELPRRPTGGLVTARSRLLDLEAGKTVARSRSQGASTDDVEAMAAAIAGRCEATIDWSNARVAVLPFTILGRAVRPETGKLLADAVARILMAAHPNAIVNRQEADALLTQHQLTPLGVEYDPAVLSGKVNWTHIITGTIRWR